MSDLTLFVLETDLSEFSENQLSKIEDILLRTQKSRLAEIDDINSAIACLNDIRRKRSDGGGGGTKKHPAK